MGRIALLIIYVGLLQVNYSVLSQINSKVFEKHPGIQTVYLARQEEQFIIKQNPVIALENQQNWFINFDDLDLNYKNYSLRIVHCDKNWNPSPLNEIEYLTDFNDIPIRDYTQSNGTKVPYKHYEVPMPTAKLSGNYAAILYANRNKRDTVFAMRYSLVDNLSNVFCKVSFANQNEFRKSHQAFQLTFSYHPSLIINDESNLKVLVRKTNANQFENLKLDKPLHNVQDRIIQYQFFGQEGLVPGGNEFRIIDLRSTQQRLSFVSHLNQQGDITEITTFPESAQGNFPYVQRNDINGSYLISNYENPQNKSFADYIYCKFLLKASPLKDEPIYLSGGFGNLIQASKLKMEWNETSGYYEKKVLLKQGIYNYKYVGSKEIIEYLEGNHSQTENEYEVLIYFQQPGTRYDALIGYSSVKFP